MENDNWLSPKMDIVFKRIFADKNNEDIIRSFLQAVLDLPHEDYGDIDIVDPHLHREDETDKLSILDLKLRTISGKTIDIEIQLGDTGSMFERIVYYSSKMITEQMSSGEDYKKIKKVITILITDFTLIKSSSEYHHRFKLTDKRNGAEFGDIIEINTLELPKLPEKESWDDLLIWLEFFRAKTEDDFMKVAKLNPQVERAVVIIRELSKDEQARFIAERDEKRRLDISSMKNFALRQGISEGLQQGISQGIQQGKQEGRLEGLHEGIQQGIVQGLKQGISQGIQQGKQEAQVDMLKLIDEGLTIKQIRERLSGR